MENRELVDQQDVKQDPCPGITRFLAEVAAEQRAAEQRAAATSDSDKKAAMNRRTPRELIDARPELFARQGSVVASWRTRNGRKYGPYYKLTYRDSGRQKSVYLGREGEAVQQVRRRLAELQEPLRQSRAVEKLRRMVTATLRIQKIRLNGQLRPLGLSLKGFEVRGWRTSPLRPVFRKQRWRIPKLKQTRGPLTDRPNRILVDLAALALIDRAMKECELELGGQPG